jgi:molybdopterin molybdotransferase
MTGAMVPEGADTVVMVEHSEVVGENQVVFSKIPHRSNICYQAEDVKTGDVVIAKNTLIKPVHVGILASVGCVEPKVYSAPTVGILTTGDEIVEPGEKPGVSKIRNVNASQLFSQVINAGAEPKYYGIIPDNEEVTYDAIKKSLEENDITLLTGGVSMGDFDFIPRVMKRLNIDIHFDSIAVQPGRPTVFGTVGDKFIFGLPGNPISSLVQFELLVKVLIYKNQNVDLQVRTLDLFLGKDYSRKRAARESWFPVKIKDSKVYPVEYHGSAHIAAYSQAEGIVAIPKGVFELKEGEQVSVRFI